MIDHAADIAHAGAVVAHHEHALSAGLVEIAPLGLALLDVLIRVNHTLDSGLVLVVFFDVKSIYIHQFGGGFDLIACLKSQIARCVP